MPLLPARVGLKGQRPFRCRYQARAGTAASSARTPLVPTRSWSTCGLGVFVSFPEVWPCGPVVGRLKSLVRQQHRHGRLFLVSFGSRSGAEGENPVVKAPHAAPPHPVVERNGVLLNGVEGHLSSLLHSHSDLAQHFALKLFFNTQ